MEELLREEEAGDEEGLRAEEGEVRVVDLFHRGCAPDAVLLGGEIIEEACWGQPAGGGEGDAHVDDVVSSVLLDMLDVVRV